MHALFIGMISLAVAASPAEPSSCSGLKSLVATTYGFRPSLLDKKAQDVKAREMDVVWQTVHLYDVARQVNGLPVHSDIGATLFVTPEGEVLTLGHDGETVPHVESDPGWRLSARLAAAGKFPELKALVPDRPPSALDCPECAGTGHIKIEGIKTDFWCSECRGLGWHP